MIIIKVNKNAKVPENIIQDITNMSNFYYKELGLTAYRTEYKDVIVNITDYPQKEERGKYSMVSFVDPIIINVFCGVMQNDTYTSVKPMYVLADNFAMVELFVSKKYQILGGDTYLAKYMGVKYTYDDIKGFICSRIKPPWQIDATKIAEEIIEIYRGKYGEKEKSC